MSQSICLPVSSKRVAGLLVLVGLLLLMNGCAGPESFHVGDLDAGDPGGGGGSGGMLVAQTGGVTGGTGGMFMGTGGTFAATGGRTGTGGAMGTGGRVGTGGFVGSGGSAATGGGAMATGGVSLTGGRPGTGGALATGGAGGQSGASGTALFNDDFESGAGRWIATSATEWSVVTDGTQVYQQGGTATNAWRGSAAGDVAWTNVSVEARLKILTLATGSSGYFIAVCARVTDANNRYCFAIRGDAKVAIRKVVGGSANSGPSANITNGLVFNVWYTARIQVVGAAITGTLSLNGAPVAVATDSDASLTAGGIQLGTQNGTARFDDVRVQSP
jgi:hypothetical protein